MRFASLVIALAACGGNPAKHLPDASPDAPPDAAPDAMVSACSMPTGAGTMHTGEITTAQTWTAADSPHVLPGDLNIVAKLTIEKCAIVQIAGGATVTVGLNGELDVMGATTEPVLIERLDPNTAWSTIRVIGGNMTLAHAILTGGGHPIGTTNPRFSAAIFVQANSSAPAASQLVVDDVDLAGSESDGVYLASGPGFDPSGGNLRIHGSAGFPIHALASLVATIPVGAYIGNGTDAIEVGYDAITTDQRWTDLGVPYHIGDPNGSRVDVAKIGGLATLTIDPGVTLAFEAGGVLSVDPTQGTTPADGALIAMGTAAKPIIFTSASPTPAAGDWHGVWFGEVAAPTTVVDHVEVHYAGGLSSSGSNSCAYASGPTTNDAAIRVLGPGLPGSDFITNTLISDSAGHGIDRGWRSDTKTDMLPTNTFTNLAGCKETYPRDASGACPATPPCP